MSQLLRVTHVRERAGAGLCAFPSIPGMHQHVCSLCPHRALGHETSTGVKSG